MAINPNLQLRNGVVSNDASGNRIRNYRANNVGASSTTPAVQGTASGVSRGGGTVSDDGNVYRTDATRATHTGGRGAISAPVPTAADFAARAGATAASGAQARATAEAAQPPAAAAPPAYGTESGNTYLEDRYLQRLYGNDPAFNYASKRGMQELGNRSAAAGNFNSGAARQQEGDFMANLIAQSQGQLDALAGGASGSRQAKTDSMFNTGLGMARGQSGINSAYDLASAQSQTDALKALLGYTTNKAGVDSQSNQQGIQNILGILGL